MIKRGKQVKTLLCYKRVSTIQFWLKSSISILTSAVLCLCYHTKHSFIPHITQLLYQNSQRERGTQKTITFSLISWCAWQKLIKSVYTLKMIYSHSEDWLFNSKQYWSSHGNLLTCKKSKGNQNKIATTSLTL